MVHINNIHINNIHKTKALVRKWAEQGDLPYLKNGICRLLTYPDQIDEVNEGPRHCEGYILMGKLLPSALYQEGCGATGVWTDHRLNILCLIDNLTDAEWLELFHDASIITSTVNDCQGLAARAQGQS